MEVSLSLTLSNLISLVRGPSEAGLGMGGQGQLPGGMAVSRLGWPQRKLQAPGWAMVAPPQGSRLPHSASSVLPTGLGLMALPLQLQLWGCIRPMTHFRGHAPSSLLGLPTPS